MMEVAGLDAVAERGARFGVKPLIELPAKPRQAGFRTDEAPLSASP